MGLIHALLFTFYWLLWLFWQTMDRRHWTGLFRISAYFSIGGLIGAAAAVNSERLDAELNLSFLLCLSRHTIDRTVCALSTSGISPDHRPFSVISIGFLLLVLLLTVMIGRLRPVAIPVVTCAVLMAVVSYTASRNELNFSSKHLPLRRTQRRALDEANSSCVLPHIHPIVFSSGRTRRTIQLGEKCDAIDTVALVNFWPSLGRRVLSILRTLDAKRLEDIPAKRLQEISEPLSRFWSAIPLPRLTRCAIVSHPCRAPALVPIESHQLEHRPVKLFYFSVGPGQSRIMMQGRRMPMALRRHASRS